MLLYKVVREHTVEKFEIRIQSYLDKGWSLHGNVVVLSTGMYVRELTKKINR